MGSFLAAVHNSGVWALSVQLQLIWVQSETLEHLLCAAWQTKINFNSWVGEVISFVRVAVTMVTGSAKSQHA